MKINVEIECTPEEARRVMGLPDFTPLHDKYTSMLMDMMDKGVQPEMLEAVVKSWVPMGEAGMNFWRRLFDASTGVK